MTDPVVPTYSGPELTAEAAKCVTVVNSEKGAILQAPDAHRKIEVMTVTHSESLVFRRRRQLRILTAQELGIADSYTFLSASEVRIMGSGSLREL